MIDDLDRQIDLFRDAGIPVGPVYTTKTAGKTATVRDPAGNIVTFVEPPREG